jgi:predicted negative regulator of RcsB-dependent stress response
MFTLAAIRAFFKGGINIVFISVIVALCTIIGVSYLSNKSKEKEIESLNAKLGAVQTAAQEFQGAASDCSAGVTAVAASEASATQAASEAVAVATVKANTYDAHASAVLSAKPVGTDDYANSKALMDSLVADRQSSLGAKQ